MDAPKGSCALLGEGRAKSCSDQKLQMKAAALSGTGRRRASFLLFSPSWKKQAHELDLKPKCPEKVKRTPPHPPTDSRRDAIGGEVDFSDSSRADGAR